MQSPRHQPITVSVVLIRSFVVTLIVQALTSGCAFGGPETRPASPIDDSMRSSVRFARVPDAEEANGNYTLSSPARGVLAGQITFDNSCQLALPDGEYALRADTVRIFVRWPSPAPTQLCPDVIDPHTYAFRIANLPSRPLLVLFYDSPERGSVRPSNAYLPARVSIR